MKSALAGVLLASVMGLGMPPAAAQQKEEQVYTIGDGVSAPQPITKVHPRYTRRAMDEGVQGTVWLTAVVGTDGQPRNIAVKQSLAKDLDIQAIAALEQWRFEPGRKDDKPVPVSITMEFTFTLK